MVRARTNRWPASGKGRAVFLAVVLILVLAGPPALHVGSAAAESIAGWLSDPRTGCRIWDSGHEADETISWSGACAGGVAQGRGVLQWFKAGTSSGRYDGDLKDGKQHGYGVSTWPGGARFEGQYRDGFRHGFGRYTWANGDRYEGEYRQGKRAGRGILSWADGGHYDGEWLDGKKHGSGVMVETNGDRYDGQWADDKAHGPGTLTQGGSVFSGTWTRGCFRQGSRIAWVGTTREACGF